MEIPRRHKSVLRMVWQTGGSLHFKLWFTWIIIKMKFIKEDK